MTGVRQAGAGHDHLGTVISPHGIDRDPHWLLHAAPATSFASRTPPIRARVQTEQAGACGMIR
jgi:hypothetical protein